MKHKHAEIICAWVNGATIQYQSPTTDKWYDVADVNKLDLDSQDPNPLHPEYDYYENWRIKP